ncbi:hypothetical protein CRD60_01165 [Bifidobacterium aemilianum]|uniref:Glycosyl transferase family 1 n=1 Tax=Bifidobacterium aemilianum TaxID=2493120 RepID=A0A366K9S6_9BIFI|nr:glycosyltransferase [Bifidobacterium aemilianum]RBP98505.1 hypothetical protein CRD60_01165 [Bifidobacterium aemilianum]
MQRGLRAIKRDRPLEVVMVADNLERNGISSFIMESCRHMDRERVRSTVLVGGEVDRQYADLAMKARIPIEQLPNRKHNPLAYYRQLGLYLQEHQVDMVHIHGNSRTMTMELLIARHHGIAVRIAHSHNTTCTHKILHTLLKPAFNHAYTSGFACSDSAGRWLFDDRPFTVIPNGVQIEHFLYDSDVRRSERSRLGLDGRFVLGHVGGLNTQKNQVFLIEVFEELAQHRPDAVLLMVGDGPDRQMLAERISRSPHRDRIMLYGQSSDPRDLYMVMDVLVFPSLFEGLPITLLEAQISGLPCLVSDRVDGQAFLSDMVASLPLEGSAHRWAQQLATMEMNRNRSAFLRDHAAQCARVDITASSQLLTREYGNFASQ